jgi:hypothetical protein
VSTRRLTRCSIALALVALGLGVSGAAFAGPQDRSMRDCRGTYINGVTQNMTDSPLVVAQTGQGLTNEWCRDANDVRARASDGWRVGDESGDTDMSIVYLLGNGDRVLFRAHITKGGATDVGCTFVEVVQPPRRFDCKAEVVAATPNFAFVRFSVLPLS